MSFKKTIYIFEIVINNVFVFYVCCILVTAVFVNSL